MDTHIAYIRSASLVGAILSISACAEMQDVGGNYFAPKFVAEVEATTNAPVATAQSAQEARAARKARLEADDDDIPVTGVRLAASSNNGNGASNGGGLVSQNSPPPTKVATDTSMPAGNGGGQIVSQASVDLNPSKLLNRGGGITSQQKPTFTLP